MAEICVFCKEQIESPYPPRLEENKMFMFEILMEQSSLDKDTLINSPMCDDCDKTISNFFSFKSDFMETEDEFINYMDSNQKVDLYDILVKTFKLKKFENENVPIRVCRICFKATQLENYKEIKSLESKLAVMVTTCLPEFNIKLTNHTYLCPECYTVILQYYHFILLCIEATKAKKESSTEISNPLSRKRPSSEIAEQEHSLSKLAKKKIDSKLYDALSKEKAIPKKNSLSSKEVCFKASSPISRKISNSLFRKKVSSDISNSFPMETTVSKTPDFLPIRGWSPENSVSDPLACSGEPNDNMVEINRPEKEAGSQLEASNSATVQFLPVRRPRGRPRTKGLVTGPRPVSKVKQNMRQQSKATNPRPVSKIKKKMHKESKAALVRTNVRYECQVCPEILHTIENLNNHIGTHQRDTIFFCWRCGFECYNYGAMNKHLQGHGMNVFKAVHNESKEGDTAGEPSKISENRKKNTPALATIDSTEVNGDLVSVKRTDIYTPPDVKKARKKRGKNRMGPSTLTSNSRSANEKSKQTKPVDDVEKDSTKYFQCQICQKILDSILEWTDHITFHRTQGSIFCSRCKEWFKSLDLLREHFFKVHYITTFYKLVPSSEVVQSSTGTIEIHSSVTDKDKKKNKSLPPFSSSTTTTTIPCIQCEEIFNHIDTYMDHVCRFRPNETPVPEKSVEKQEFNCGHCNNIFYSLDDLDDHICTPTQSGGDDGKSGDGSTELSRKSGINQICATTSPPQTESTDKNQDADYECSYCLRTFNTITALDNHICNEDAESTAPENIALENVALKNTAPVRACGAVAVKKETLFECSHCVTLFESGLELSQHKCSNASANTEVISVDAETVSEDISADDGMSRLLKADPEYNCFLPSDSGVELEKEHYNNVQPKVNIPDVDPVNKNADDISKCRNVENQEKLHETPESARLKKRNTINKIANMFGVNVVEGKDRQKDDNSETHFNCIGCGLTSLDHKSLVFHLGFCDKIFRCSYCSYGTNISQKLEIHSWTIHNILIFVCSWCTFVTSMEENYDAHLLTHKENCQNDDVQYISDDAEEQPKSPESMLNELFNFEKFKNGRTGPVSKNVFHVINQKTKDRGQQAAGSGNLTNPVAVTINRPLATVTSTNQNDTAFSNLNSKDTLSAENIWPDSDDDLDDAEAFRIPKDIETSKNDPLATEPVWLVKSTAVNENGANRQTDVDTLDERNDGNMCELIIPDRIIPEPTSFKSESLEDPLEGNDTERQNTETSPEAPKSLSTDAVASKPSNSDNAETVKMKPLNSTEPIVINCDSDSDSEFVEPSDSLMSTVAACAREVVPISASEASKLISEGIPVINNTNFFAKQIGALPTAPKIVAMAVQSLPKSSDSTPDTVDSTDPPSLPSQQSNAVLIIENQNNAQDASLNTVSSDKEVESAKTSKNKDDEPNFTKAEHPQPERSKESFGRNDVVIVDQAKNTGKEDTITDSNKDVDIANNTDSTTSKSKINVTIERQLEDDGANSDASSFFVTDNEDSDKEDLEESRKKSTAQKDKGSANTPDMVKQKKTGSKKTVGKSYLKIYGDNVVISDDEDDKIKKHAPIKGLVNANDTGNKKEGSKTQTTTNNFLKAALLRPSSSKTLSKEKSPKTYERVKGNSGKISTKNTEESFIISDDDEEGVSVSIAAKENNVSGKEKQTPQAIQILSEAIKLSTGKNIIVKYAKILPAKNKNSKQYSKSSLETSSKIVSVIKPVAKDAESVKIYSRVAGNSNVQSTGIQNKSLSVSDILKQVTSTTYARMFGNKSNQNKTTNVDGSTEAAKSTSALATCSKKDDNGAKQSNRVQKTTPVQNKLVKETAISTDDSWVVIDDEDEDIRADKGDTDKNPAPRSRKDSSSSSIILDRDFSKEVDDETTNKAEANDSGDDCVFVSEDKSVGQSKNPGSPKTAENTSSPEGLKLPPNALNLFVEKVKSEIKQKYPKLQWGAQKNIILDAWRCMSNEDKWPFKEEARLHRLLFKREHPDNPMKKKKVPYVPRAKMDDKSFRRAVKDYFNISSISINDAARRHGLNTKTFQRRLQRLREKNTKEEILRQIVDANDSDSSDDPITVTEALPTQPPQPEDLEAIILD